MSQPATKEAPAPAVPLADQIAAVEECIKIARDVADGVLGRTAGFVALRELYTVRIARLEAAAATLRATAGAACRG